MKRVVVLVIGLSLALALIAQGSAQRLQDLQGWRPYTPSRIEWLAVELNANHRIDAQIDKEYSLTFVADGTTDTIVIGVGVFPYVNREMMNMGINHARKMVRMTAEKYGWDTWVKIRVKMLEK